MMTKYPTVRSVRDEVARIAEIADNDELAHLAEDYLFASVLATIANGEHDDTAADLAREALYTHKIDFSRECCA